MKKYIQKKYIDTTLINIYKYKVILPKADGNGRFGEIVTNPTVLSEGMGYTHTFYGIGLFNTEIEANNCLKYTKTKFARTLLYEKYNLSQDEINFIETHVKEMV